ncbi:MAG: hypothetical protein WBO04_13120 [Steroidobacteraceae bacterium]
MACRTGARNPSRPTRPGKDGRTNAKLKLIAGLLGVGFDELKQREHRRQQRRLLLVTAAALTGVLITGALAITAWLARQDAVRNRDRAEDLIGFMLGDFRQQLEPLGKLELLKGVGDKAMAYFSSLEERDITNESLLRRAEALRQIGEVRLALGNAWFWVGYTHWQKGDLAAAVAPMSEYFQAAVRLTQLAPGNAKWQLEQGYAFANLGSLAAARGEDEAAIGYFEGANAVVERLIADAPADVGLLLTRIENYSWLASINQGRGALREANALHGKALQLTTELLASRPDDRRIQREEVLRQVFYGRVLLAMGEIEESERVSREAFGSARALAALDPQNAQWQWQLASVMEQVSRVLHARGRCTEALSMAEAGLEVTTALAAKTGDMDIGQLTQLQLLSGKAACLLEAGRLDESETALAPLLARTRVPEEDSVNAVHYEIVLATGRLLAGQVEAARGRADRAMQAWTAGLDLLSPRRSDPGHRAVRAMLLQSLGRTEQARQLAAELVKIGLAEPNFTRQMRVPAPPG